MTRTVLRLQLEGKQFGKLTVLKRLHKDNKITI